MAKTVSVAEAKNHLSELLSRVGYGGERFIIERHGKPIGALVSPDDLEQLNATGTSKPRGLQAAFACSEGIEGVDTLFEDVVKSRADASDREVDLG